MKQYTDLKTALGLFEGELAFIFGGRIGRALRGAPVVHHSDLLYAGDSTHLGAWLFCVKFTSDVFAGVVFKRNGGIAALLRTVVNQSVFADVQVSCAGAAPPVVRPAVGKI